MTILNRVINYLIAWLITESIQNADLWRVQVAIQSPLAQLDEEIEPLLPVHRNVNFIDKLIFSHLVHGRL